MCLMTFYACRNKVALCDMALKCCVGRYIVVCLLYGKSLRTVILSVVSYGCETWSQTLKEERSLRVFDDRVLTGIFGAKRDEVTGEWRKLDEERHIYTCHPLL
jgi:hypothetical protein